MAVIAASLFFGEQVRPTRRQPPDDPMTFQTQNTFKQALALHQQGQLGRAQDLYREVLLREPRHFDSLHLLGLTHVQAGDAEKGAGLIAQAIAVKADFAEAHYNMGNALLSLQRPAEALESFDTALRLAPRDPQYHFERGNALKDLGRLGEALSSYDEAIRLFPGSAEAHNNRGVTLKEAGRLAEALASYDAALSLKPQYAEAHGNRGNALKELGRLDEALAGYDAALGLKPDYAEAHSSRGNALARLGQLDAALASHDRALALKPDYAEGHNNRGLVLNELGRSEEALASYDAAIRLRPGYAEAYSNRGNALKDLRRMDEALASLHKAISLKPGFAEAHINLGNALNELDRTAEAIAHYEKAAQIDPASAMAPYNKSLVLLQLNHFREGFELYRWRWEGDGSGRAGPRTGIPAWDGLPTDGEVLLWAEQGVGDEVFFASMLSLIDPARHRIALSADRRLHPIFARSFPDIRLLDVETTRTSITGRFAAQAPIGDLGRILQADARMLGRRRYPYLATNRERCDEIRSNTDVPEGNLICGLSWRSGNAKVGAQRSLQLADLSPALHLPGVTFVNLQYGDVSEIGIVKERLGVEVIRSRDLDVFSDIDGLLALIDVCDVVITIDNLTAHLAGSIGKQGAVLIPRGGARHWYWGSEAKSFWYPSLQPILQREPGSWESAIAEASRYLVKLRGAVRA